LPEPWLPLLKGIHPINRAAQNPDRDGSAAWTQGRLKPGCSGRSPQRRGDPCATCQRPASKTRCSAPCGGGAGTL